MNNQQIIDDDFILNYFYTSTTNKINANKLRNIPDEIKLYLENRYLDSDSLKETINRIKYHIEIRPICEHCGGHVKYLYLDKFSKFCSYKCSANNDATREKCKCTCQLRYGVDNVSQLDEVKEKSILTQTERYHVSSYSKTQEYKDRTIATNNEKYGCNYYVQTDEYKSKSIQTCNEKYGCDYVFQSDVFKEQSKNTMLNKYDDINFRNAEKARETNLFKYGADSWTQTDYGREYLSNIANSEQRQNKSKQTCLSKYNCEYFSQTSEFNDKRFKTMLKNGTCGGNKSKQEQQVYELLINIFPDVIHFYSSSLYPWICDFYIPSLSLYIEYQGTWTHGGQPYIKNDQKCQEQLNKWNIKATNSKYYKNAIKNWTITDVLKRQTAFENNLNYIEFWTINEVKEWILNQQKQN